MHTFAVNCTRGLVVAGMAAALLGCPNPQTYGTPRTTPAGKISHTVALEGFHLGSTTKVPTSAAGTVRETSTDVTLPTLPTYQLRVGLADRVDLGARVANLSSLGVDVKWNFMKSESIDLAVNPGMQAIYFSSGSTTTAGSASSSIFIFYGHLPLMAGFNFGESATLVLTGGLVAAYASNSAGGSGRDAAVSAGGLGGRAGVGMQFRVTKKFALHPEVTGMRFFTGPAGDNDLLAIVFGLGFNFGNLPSYAKGSETDEEEKKTDGAPLPAPGPAPAPGAAPAPGPAPAAPPPPGGA